MDGDGNFEGALQLKAISIADACTRCGKCFDVCPMTAPAGDADPENVLTGVVDILRIEDGNAEGRRWASLQPQRVLPRCLRLWRRSAIDAVAGPAFPETGRG